MIEKVDSSGKSPAITLYGNLAPYDVIILIEHDTLIKNKYDKYKLLSHIFFYNYILITNDSITRLN